MEILLVEDNPADVLLFREALKQDNGGNLSVVTDGQAALSFVRQEGTYNSARRPDLIFLDLNLPKKDGPTVLAEMKSDPRLRHIPNVKGGTDGKSEGGHSEPKRSEGEETRIIKIIPEMLRPTASV